MKKGNPHFLHTLNRHGRSGCAEKYGFNKAPAPTPRKVPGEENTLEMVRGPPFPRMGKPSSEKEGLCRWKVRFFVVGFLEGGKRVLGGGKQPLPTRKFIKSPL